MRGSLVVLFLFLFLLLNSALMARHKLGRKPKGSDLRSYKLSKKSLDDDYVALEKVGGAWAVASSSL